MQSNLADGICNEYKLSHKFKEEKMLFGRKICGKGQKNQSILIRN